MKTNIEIDLNWINEEGSIDEGVKQYIVEAISEGLSKKCLDDIAESARRQVNEQLGQKVANLFDSFMEEGIVVVDKWGDPVRGRERIKIRDLMKEKLDKALAEKVNKNNGEASSSYGGIPRIDYFLNKRIDDLLDAKYGRIIKDVEKMMETKLGNTLSQTLATKLLKALDIESIVKEAFAK